MLIDFLNDRITISLEDFLKHLLKKWKMIIAIVIMSAVLFAVFSYTIGEEITAPPSEEYIYYEKNLESINNYFDHSILMQMDPMKIYQRTMFLRNISDKEMLKMAKNESNKLNLGMKFLTSEYTLDKSKLIFYFTAEDRVDFRELVKILASEVRTRIELRQIGVRDKAKEIGGLGPCGMPLCCSNYLYTFDNITINM